MPFNGAAPAINALTGGQVDYMCDGGALNSVPHVPSGTIKAYTIDAEQRSPILANVPTAKEAGLPDFKVSAWVAMFAPKGTPKPTLDRLTNALDSALDDDISRKRLVDLVHEIPEKASRGQFRSSPRNRKATLENYFCSSPRQVTSAICGDLTVP